MFFSAEFTSGHPILFVLLSSVTLVFYLALIWVIGRMGDNINQIQKMLEQEIKRRQSS